MKTNATIVGNSTVRLWGLDGATRLERQLRAAGAVVGAADGEAASTLLVRGDWLFDDRLLRSMLARPGSVLLATGAQAYSVPVAAHVSCEAAATAREVIEGRALLQSLGRIHLETPASLSNAWTGPMLKASAAAAIPIRRDQARTLARYLFDGAYKGVTDLVTKWVWPAPARLVTGICARLGLSPNTVTTASWVLAIAATWRFAVGDFAGGLAMAWAMTFLDTVDGKLARVTVTSSRLGHLFDHVLDLLHPPLWYLAWGWGAAGVIEGFDPAPAFSVILAGYVAGRLAEGCFEGLLAGFSLFAWRPADSYFRLVLARRNPNLLLLSAFAIAGRPDHGLVAVAAWTAACSVLLVLRVSQAGWLRFRRHRLEPWLAALPCDARHLPVHARPFAARPAPVLGTLEEARGQT